ncbi:MAG: hypothetical protein GKR94_16685 [Gammaproteobacteria bacterium]|nr:hypothetical protein [Gammaproteobacteria bacterium]
MKAAGLPCHRMIRFVEPPMSIEDGFQISCAFDQHFGDADHVFCVSDVSAFGVLSALKQQGIPVPEDLAIAGFGNFE